MLISQCSNMETRLLIYYLSIALGGLLSAICGYFLGTKRGVPKKPLRIFLCLALFFGFFGAFLMGQLQNFVMSLTGLRYELSRMRIFGGLLFMPLFLYLPARYLAGDFRLLTDIFAPGAFLILGCSKIGCAVYGCCYGIPWEYGVATPFENHLCFPSQVLEAVICFALFGLMYILYTKNRFRRGAAYPAGLILYGVTRFLCEYLRYYPEAQRTYFLGVSFWQLISLFSVIIGVLWLIGGCRKSFLKKAG